MKTIVVLMSTYNGENFLKEQIDSVLAQEGVIVSLLVRDDGSSDGTLNILDEYASKGMLKWFSGENLKPAKSFFNLMKCAPNSDYYAFCDQDDYWEKDKLVSAVEKLDCMNSEKPLLYCSATKLVNAELRPINQKNRFPGVTDFKTAIISSNATGCTMCFNKKLLDFVNLYNPDVNIMHDGWVHKLCLAIGGEVFYDKKSHILYRQHGKNVVGGNSSVLKKWKRRYQNLKTMCRIRSRAIQEIAEKCKDLMPEQNYKMAGHIFNYEKTLFSRVSLAFNFEIKFPVKETDFIYRMAVLLGMF